MVSSRANSQPSRFILAEARGQGQAPAFAAVLNLLPAIVIHVFGQTNDKATGALPVRIHHVPGSAPPAESAQEFGQLVNRYSLSLLALHPYIIAPDIILAAQFPFADFIAHGILGA
jgi:hypothetical protein